MMDTTNIAFDIGDQSMDPGQDLRGLFARTGDQPPIFTVVLRTVARIWNV